MSDYEVQGANRWNTRYAEGATGWDLDAPAPSLVDLLARLGPADEPKPARVLVVGAGYGHDALAWARAGYAVTAVDFAPLAIEGLKARAEGAGVAVDAVLADLFALPASFEGAFDMVWEQTCFCAISPAQRPAYAAAVHRALRVGGTLYGVFWNNEREDGPPFDTTPDAVRAAFTGTLTVVDLAPLPAALCARKGEFFVRATR